METEDNLLELHRLEGLFEIEIGRKDKRPMCNKCRRPASVCWCVSLPPSCLSHVRSRVVILQHPNEEKRCLRTAPMLEQTLPACKIYKGKKFNSTKVPELSGSNVVLMFPGHDATDVSTLPPRSPDEDPYTLLVLDGTWHQARAIMNNSPHLRTIPKVIVRTTLTSKYVIRTQPSDAALSTVESVALALSSIEGDGGIYQTLVKPLETLCYHQLRHGAVVHHSKEKRIRDADVTVVGKRMVKTLSQCGAEGVRGGEEGGKGEQQGVWHEAEGEINEVA